MRVSITVDGRRLRDFAQLKRAIGFGLNPFAHNPKHTALQHLRWQARLAAFPGDADRVLDLVGLGSVAGRLTGKFSHGMLQRLGIATALLGDPRCVVLDEPANGLDVEGTLWLRELFRTLTAQGKAVLVASHSLSEVEITADRIIIMGKGRVLTDASRTEVLALDRVPAGWSRRTWPSPAPASTTSQAVQGHDAPQTRHSARAGGAASSGSANPVTHLLRAVRAEFAKLGHRSPLWYAVLPLAAFIPAALTFGIAKAVQLNKIDAAAAWTPTTPRTGSSCSHVHPDDRRGDLVLRREFRDGTTSWPSPSSHADGCYPSPNLSSSAVSRYGLDDHHIRHHVGYHLLFPRCLGPSTCSPTTVCAYGSVRRCSRCSSLRSVSIVGAVPRPGLVVMLILLWKFGVEKFVEFLQGTSESCCSAGHRSATPRSAPVRWVTFDSPFGGALGSMLYFAAIAIGFFIAGVVHLAKADLRSGD